MFQVFLFATAVIVLIYMKRKACQGFRQHPHARVNRRHLHGGMFVDGFTRACAAEKEAVSAAAEGAFRFVAGEKQTLEYAHISITSCKMIKKS